MDDTPDKAWSLFS